LTYSGRIEKKGIIIVRTFGRLALFGSSPLFFDLDYSRWRLWSRFGRSIIGFIFLFFLRHPARSKSVFVKLRIAKKRRYTNL